MGVVKTAAPIAANLVLPGSGSIVGGLMDSVLKTHSTYSDDEIKSLGDEEKAAIFSKHPELMAELKTKAMELEASIAKEQTKNMSDVNETARAELNAGNWWQKGWRPFNGYMFPVAVILCYVVVPVWAWHANALLTVEVPATLWVIWAGILGVAVYGRNQEKKPAGGTSPGGIMKVIKTLRGK